MDEYRGKQVPAGKKSLTARLTIGSTEKTLTSAEIEEVANSVLKSCPSASARSCAPAEPAPFSGTGAFPSLQKPGEGVY